jgi:hypothetical protein
MKIYIPSEDLLNLVKGDTYNFRGRSFIFLGTNDLIRFCPHTFYPTVISYLNFNDKILLSITKSDETFSEYIYENKEDVFQKIENIYLTLKNIKHSKSLLVEKEFHKSKNNTLLHLEDLENKNYNHTF